MPIPNLFSVLFKHVRILYNVQPMSLEVTTKSLFFNPFRLQNFIKAMANDGCGFQHLKVKFGTVKNYTK